MIVEYLDGTLSEKEKIEIKDLPYKYIRFSCYRPYFTNSAFDELIGQIIIWLSSDEVNAVVNAEIAGVIFAVIRFIFAKTKQKKCTQLTYKKQTLRPLNVIIKVDNVSILQPDNCDEISLEDYLEMALSLVASTSSPDVEMVISYNEGLHFETLEQYVSRKTNKIINKGGENEI